MEQARVIAEAALAAAQGAVDEIIGLLLDSEGSVDADHVAGALMEVDERSDHLSSDRRGQEAGAALMIVMGARAVLPPENSSPDESIDPQDGYVMLRSGDRDGARVFAHELLETAGRLATDDWNFGNVVHHAHILRGKLFLDEGDVEASAAELLAAGGVSGSPQLDSFGPDLSLAWRLLEAGEDESVLAYLKLISRFWRPKDPAQPKRAVSKLDEHDTQ